MQPPPTIVPGPRLCRVVKSKPDEKYGFDFYSDKVRGIFIYKVVKDSPADMCGLLRGDRISVINGIDVTNLSYNNIVERINEYPMECQLAVLNEDGIAESEYAEQNLHIPIKDNLIIKSKTEPDTFKTNPKLEDIAKHNRSKSEHVPSTTKPGLQDIANQTMLKTDPVISTSNPGFKDTFINSFINLLGNIFIKSTTKPAAIKTNPMLVNTVKHTRSKSEPVPATSNPGIDDMAKHTWSKTKPDTSTTDQRLEDIMKHTMSKTEQVSITNPCLEDTPKHTRSKSEPVPSTSNPGIDDMAKHTWSKTKPDTSTTDQRLVDIMKHTMSKMEQVSTTNPCLEDTAKYTRSKTDPVTSTTNPGQEAVEKHTTLNVDRQDEIIINGSIGKGATIIVYNQSKCTINGSIGEGVKINVYDQSKCIINGSFCKGAEIHINAYNISHIEVKEFMSENVTFNTFDLGKIEFMTRPSEVIIDKIKSNCKIVMPGGYTPQANTASSNSSTLKTLTQNEVTIGNTNFINDSSFPDVITNGDCSKKDTINNAHYRNKFEQELCFNGCTLRLFKGDIVSAAKNCDVIVNTTNSYDLLAGGASCRAIVNAAGPNYVKEIKELYPTGMNGKSLVCTGSGNLPCLGVYHIALLDWNNASGEKILVEKINNCLTEISKDTPLFESIAFPAIGTGGLKYPTDVVARIMFEATINWLKSHRNSSLKCVTFVIFPSDILAMKQFENVFKTFISRETRTVNNVADLDDDYTSEMLDSDDSDKLVVLNKMSRSKTGLVTSTTIPELKDTEKPTFSKTAHLTSIINPVLEDIATHSISMTSLVKSSTTSQELEDVMHTISKTAPVASTINPELEDIAKHSVSMTALVASSTSTQRLEDIVMHTTANTAPVASSTSNQGLEVIAKHTFTQTAPVTYTTVQGLEDIVKHTILYMDSYNEERIIGSIGERAIINVYNQSKCTIYGSIGEGTSINMYKESKCVINGLFCKGAEIYVRAYNSSHIKVTNVKNENVTFSALEWGKIEFMMRPSEAIIAKIKVYKSGQIVMPGGYTPQVNFARSNSSMLPTLTQNRVTIATTNCINDSSLPGLITDSACAKTAILTNAHVTSNNRNRFEQELCFNGCTLRLFKGDILSAAKSCSIIVNTTNSNDLLAGGASSRAIINAAGSKYVEEIKELYPDGMKGKSLVCTGSGNLPCLGVYHIALPDWNNASGEKILTEKINNCLTEISKDPIFKSIAFPAIGTGGLKYPTDVVARTMFEATINWLKSHQNSTLKCVTFVVFPSDILAMKPFENVFKAFISRETKTVNNVADLDDNYTLEMLDSNSEEYETVKSAIFRTSSPRIIKIERILNPFKYDQYMAEKRKLLKSLRSNLVVERNLFHGTDRTNISGICNNGFNRSLSGKNGTKFGNGSYFARDFSYSMSYGSAVIFYANVLTGNFTKGESNMIVAPDMDKDRGTKYDSVVDDMKDPSIFVIFSDNHAYPEYLISYLPK